MGNFLVRAEMNCYVPQDETLIKNISKYKIRIKIRAVLYHSPLQVKENCLARAFTEPAISFLSNLDLHIEHLHEQIMFNEISRDDNFWPN